MQLGIRQARYVGRQKTLFQLLMAATVANLTLLASRGDWESWNEVPQALALSLLLLVVLAGTLPRPAAAPWSPIAARIARHPRTHRRLSADLLSNSELTAMAGSRPAF